MEEPWHQGLVSILLVGIYTLTTPDIHGTTTGAFGCAFLNDSEYRSLKVDLAFSACK